jgi:hypothetical protein
MTILDTAARLVDGDREASYGHPAHDYDATGRITAAILDRWLRSKHPGLMRGRFPDVPADIGCLLMVGVKLSREAGHHKLDNLVDGAGYFRCAEKVREAPMRTGYTAMRKRMA